MEIRDKVFAQRYRDGLVTVDEMKNHLVRNYSVFDLADELAGYLIEDSEFKRNQIILSPKQEQLLKVLLRNYAVVEHKTTVAEIGKVM